MPRPRNQADDELRQELHAAAEILPVDVDAAWQDFLDRTAPNGGQRGVSSGRWLVAVGVAILLVALPARPVLVSVSVQVVRAVREVIHSTQPEAAPSTSVPVNSPGPVPPPTFSLPDVTPTPSSAPASAPAPTPTEPTKPVPNDQVAHATILDGDQYRLTVGRVHEQINDAVGY